MLYLKHYSYIKFDRKILIIVFDPDAFLSPPYRELYDEVLYLRKV